MIDPDTYQYPLLPDSAEVSRANGRYTCETCGKQLRDHPRYRYPAFGTCVLGCDSTFYHL